MKTAFTFLTFGPFLGLVAPFFWAVDANFGIDEFTLEPQSPRFILALNGGLVHSKLFLVVKSRQSIFD